MLCSKEINKNEELPWSDAKIGELRLLLATAKRKVLVLLVKCCSSNRSTSESTSLSLISLLILSHHSESSTYLIEIASNLYTYLTYIYLSIFLASQLHASKSTRIAIITEL